MKASIQVCAKIAPNHHSKKAFPTASTCLIYVKFTSKKKGILNNVYTSVKEQDNYLSYLNQQKRHVKLLEKKSG